jgi:hypothetical protein
LCPDQRTLNHCLRPCGADLPSTVYSPRNHSLLFMDGEHEFLLHYGKAGYNFARLATVPLTSFTQAGQASPLPNTTKNTKIITTQVGHLLRALPLIHYALVYQKLFMPQHSASPSTAPPQAQRSSRLYRSQNFALIRDYFPHVLYLFWACFPGIRVRRLAEKYIQAGAHTCRYECGGIIGGNTVKHIAAQHKLTSTEDHDVSSP